MPIKDMSKGNPDLDMSPERIIAMDTAKEIPEIIRSGFPYFLYMLWVT